MEVRSKSNWSKEDDETLVRLVREIGETKWKKIWTAFRSERPETYKTYNQCRERWFNTVNPSIIRGRISDEEKKAIFRLHQRYGNKWNLISKELSGRPDNTIKTFFYSEIRKAIKQHNKANPQNRILRTPKSLARDPQASIILKLCDSPHEPVKPPTPPTELFPCSVASWDTFFMLITGRIGLPR